MAKAEVASKTISIDKKNANRGTDRGQSMLVESFKKYGAGRSVLIDKNGHLIAGNKSYQAAVDGGAVASVKVVVSDGREVIAVKRLDLDLLMDPLARQLAYADNRIAEVNLHWDEKQLAADIEAGVDVGQFWFDDELAKLISGNTGDLEPGGGGGSENPDFNSNNNGVRMVQLFLTDTSCPTFLSEVQKLMEGFGIDNLTDAVLEALQREADLVPAEVEKAGSRRINLN